MTIYKVSIFCIPVFEDYLKLIPPCYKIENIGCETENIVTVDRIINVGRVN